MPVACRTIISYCWPLTGTAEDKTRRSMQLQQSSRRFSHQFVSCAGHLVAGQGHSGTLQTSGRKGTGMLYPCALKISETICILPSNTWRLDENRLVCVVENTGLQVSPSRTLNTFPKHCPNSLLFADWLHAECLSSLGTQTSGVTSFHGILRCSHGQKLRYSFRLCIFMKKTIAGEKCPFSLSTAHRSPMSTSVHKLLRIHLFVQET